MKTCPVCKAVAFADQVRCFGCLYDFGKEAPIATHAPESAPIPVPASFTLSLKPVGEGAGAFAWTCSVEPVRL